MNIGNRKSVRLVCGPCNGARRLFDGQARGMDSLVKSELADLKKNRQSEYKERVRAARLLPGGERTVAFGARREMVNSFLTSIAVSKELKEVSAIEWLTREEFVGHHMVRLGLSRPEAEARWSAEVRNPTRARRGPPENCRLAVQAPPPNGGQFRGRGQSGV